MPISAVKAARVPLLSCHSPVSTPPTGDEELEGKAPKLGVVADDGVSGAVPFVVLGKKVEIVAL